MIEPQFSYGQSLRTGLISLVLRTVNYAGDVFSIYSALTISRLFCFVSRGETALNALVVEDSATLNFC